MTASFAWTVRERDCGSPSDYSGSSALGRGVPLPQPILQKIEQIEAEKTSQPVEYAVTVSIRLRGDCAWAGKGYETAFGQGVFLTEKSTVSDDETETVSGCAEAKRLLTPGRTQSL